VSAAAITGYFVLHFSFEPKSASGEAGQSGCAYMWKSADAVVNLNLSASYTVGTNFVQIAYNEGHNPRFKSKFQLGAASDVSSPTARACWDA